VARGVAVTDLVPLLNASCLGALGHLRQERHLALHSGAQQSVRHRSVRFIRRYRSVESVESRLYAEQVPVVHSSCGRRT
jgi:hypothetical protein